MEYKEELIMINGIGEKTADDIMKVYPTIGQLYNALRDLPELPFRDDVSELLHKHFHKLKTEVERDVIQMEKDKVWVRSIQSSIIVANNGNPQYEIEFADDRALLLPADVATHLLSQAGRRFVVGVEPADKSPPKNVGLPKQAKILRQKKASSFQEG